MTAGRPERRLYEDNQFAQARETERTLHAIQNGRAARVVAHNALDLADCVDLLSMLGLDAVEGKHAGAA